MTTRLLTVTILLMCAAPLFAQTTGTTLSKSFNTEGKSKVKLDLPGAVDLKIWDQANIRIEVHVSLANGSVSMLNALANGGRYNMISTISPNELLINVPKMARPVMLKGEVLAEQTSFVVYVPEGMEVEIIKPAVPALVTAR